MKFESAPEEPTPERFGTKREEWMNRLGKQPSGELPKTEQDWTIDPEALMEQQEEEKKLAARIEEYFAKEGTSKEEVYRIVSKMLQGWVGIHDGFPYLVVEGEGTEAYEKNRPLPPEMTQTIYRALIRVQEKTESPLGAAEDLFERDLKDENRFGGEESK